MLTFHHRQELRDTQVSAYNHVIRKIRRHINNNVIVLIDDGLSVAATVISLVLFERYWVELA